MNSQPRPVSLVGSVLVISACAVLMSIGLAALFTPALLTKLSGAVLVIVPGLTGVLQYCGTFRQSHDAALLAGTCLALLVVPSFLLSVVILTAGVNEVSLRPVLLTAGASLLGLALGGGWMMIVNLQQASELEDAGPLVAPLPRHRVAAEAVGVAILLAAIGVVAAMLQTTPLADLLLRVI